MAQFNVKERVKTRIKHRDVIDAIWGAFAEVDCTVYRILGSLGESTKSTNLASFNKYCEDTKKDIEESVKEESLDGEGINEESLEAIQEITKIQRRLKATLEKCGVKDFPNDLGKHADDLEGGGCGDMTESVCKKDPDNFCAENCAACQKEYLARLDAKLDMERVMKEDDVYRSRKMVNNTPKRMKAIMEIASRFENFKAKLRRCPPMLLQRVQ